MRGGVQLTIASVLLLLHSLSPTSGYRCDRTPEGIVAPKTPADNRFQLKISGTPDKYVPGTGYTISLQGQKTQGQNVAQKFVGFTLVVEPQSFMPLRVLTARDVTPRSVGMFTLYGDTLTKFSSSCPNMVTHTSSMPKSEVQVRWTSPPPGSGCIIFRATVIEHPDVWYQDDGPLSKMLCEEVQENLDTQPDVIQNCCACDEAKYEVTFEGLWSRHTHPKDFPSNSWLTRFSDVIGASHSPHYKFWEYGGIATEGLRQLAERGSTRMLESELKSNSPEIRTIIKARGISYPNVTGKTFAVFRVNRFHHLMSLVSMIDPSPDWIVGVSALELCLRNCSWVESKILNLYPWDAGTDSGITYISPDQQTVPREKIRRITSSFPNDPHSPFYDPLGLEMKPLARLYLTRQRLYEKTCEDGPELAEGCALSEWGPWGPCSATCGQGKRYRRREYYRNSKNCRTDVKLTAITTCYVQHCRQVSSYPNPDADRPFAEPEQEYFDPNCDVAEWSDWSRCTPTDSTCEKGVQKRYRHVRPRNPSKNKLCLSIQDYEEEDCKLSKSVSSCPKNFRGKPFFKGPLSSTCCSEDGDNNEEDEYGNINNNDGDQGENNETTDQEYTDFGDGGNGKEEEENGYNNQGYSNGDGDFGRHDGYSWNNEEVDGEEGNGNYEEGNGDYEGGNGIYEESNGVGGEGNGDGENGIIGGDEGNGDGEEENGDGEEFNHGEHDYGDGDNDYKREEEPTGECAMMPWSEWTPCSVTCGVGERKRTRQLLNLLSGEGPRTEYQRMPHEDNDYGAYDDEEGSEAEMSVKYADSPCSGHRILEVEPCNGSSQGRIYPTCQLSPEDATEICALPPHPGLCRGPMLMRWHYEPRIEDCTQFEWTGCRGNKNRFLSREECKNACQAYTAEAEDKFTTEEIITGEDGDLPEAMGQTKDETEGLVEGTERPVRNCRFSKWSPWSKCKARCNKIGIKVRTRHIEVHAKNGGKACVGKTRKQKRCIRKCKDGEDEDYEEEEEEIQDSRCKYGEWSDWTECTASCGMSAIKQQTRLIEHGDPAECTDRIRRKPCNVGPCPQ